MYTALMAKRTVLFTLIVLAVLIGGCIWFFTRHTQTSQKPQQQPPITKVVETTKPATPLQKASRQFSGLELKEISKDGNKTTYDLSCYYRVSDTEVVKEHRGFVTSTEYLPNYDNICLK